MNVRDHYSETVRGSVWGREGGGVDSAINMAGSHTPSKDGKGCKTLPEMVTHMWHRAGLHSRLAARTTHARGFTEDK